MIFFPFLKYFRLLTGDEALIEEGFKINKVMRQEKRSNGQEKKIPCKILKIKATCYFLLFSAQ